MLPDPLHYNVESSDHALTGQRVQYSPSCSDLSEPFEGPALSPSLEAWGLWTHGLFVYLFACVFVCTCVCMCLCVCFWVSEELCKFCMFLCVSLYVYMCMLVFSMCLCVCLCHCGWCICLCDCLFENAFVSVCLCPCTVVGASLVLTLRGRRIPVHMYTPGARLDQWYPVERSLVVGFIHPTKHHHTALRLASVERRQRGDP